MVVTWVLKLYIKKSFPLCKVLHLLLVFITEINFRLHCLLIRFNHNLTNIFIQQKQPPGYSVKKCYLQNLTKFAGKHLCKRLCALACSFIKKESLAQLFSFEFCEISNNTFFTEHHQTTTFDLQNIEYYLSWEICFEFIKKQLLWNCNIWRCMKDW